MTSPDYAVAACASYQHWASEVRRLTDAITDCECPLDTIATFESEEDARCSCFTEAKTEFVPAGSQPDDGDRPKTLDEIGEEVKDCESCTQLVTLIRERKHARQRWGVAKRKVRAAGKRALS